MGYFSSALQLKCVVVQTQRDKGGQLKGNVVFILKYYIKIHLNTVHMCFV